MNVLKMFDGKVEFVEIGVEEINVLFENGMVSLEGVSIEEFDFSGGELFLCKDEGYRGEGYYEGIFKRGEKKYYVDVVNDGVVFEVVDELCEE